MDRPTLRQLEYAVAVDEFRSFSKAAVACQVSQPGLSAQVAELERRLGVALFERTRSATTPTPAGEEVLRRARAILRSVDDLLHVTDVHRDTVAGVLRVAAIPTMAPYLLPGIVRTMRTNFPTVSLSIGESRTNVMVERLVGNDLDMGLLATPVGHPGLTEFVIADDPFLLAVGADHPLAQNSDVHLSALEDSEVLLIEDGHCLRDQTVEVCQLAGMNNLRDVGSAGLSTVCQMVVSGQGVALLPQSAATLECRPGSGLTGIPFAPLADGSIAKRTIALAWRTSSPHADEFVEFAEMMKQAMAESLAH